MGKTRTTKIASHLSEVEKIFDAENQSVYSKDQIKKLMDSAKEFGFVSKNISIQNFCDFLIQESKLQKWEFKLIYGPFVRFTWNQNSPYEVIKTSNSNGYFSHYTSLYMNGLTEQIPKSIYFNIEQSPKPVNERGMNQSAIDLAFSRKQRETNNICTVNGTTFKVLSGKWTNNLGVEEGEHIEFGRVRKTDGERTLIDSIVRPNYSGGVAEILKAFRLAKQARKISVKKIYDYLQIINHKYPYHQVIGWYLEMSGVFTNEEIEFFENIEKQFDFYLNYELKNPSYSRRWRLYYPKGFELS